MPVACVQARHRSGRQILNLARLQQQTVDFYTALVRRVLAPEHDRKFSEAFVGAGKNVQSWRNADTNRADGLWKPCARSAAQGRMQARASAITAW
jgi:hypothetical protein